MILTAWSMESTAETQARSIESRGRIPKELVTELERLVPYVDSNTRRGSNKGINQKNDAITSIEIIEGMLSEREWVATLPKEWLSQVTNNPADRWIGVPHDIKSKLALMGIDCINRQGRLMTQKQGN